MRYLFLASVLFSVSAISAAEEAAEPAVDAEQLSQDMLKNVDSWIGGINDKIQSDKPVTDEDLDSIFNDSFFSTSEDPVRDIELTQKRLDAKLGAGSKDLDATYSKWMEKKLSPSDLSPETVSDAKHITVKLKVPGSAAASLKINIARGRIKLNFNKQETRQDRKQDGSVTSSSVTRRTQRVMAVPKGANPDKYRVKTSKGSVNIIFDRLKKNPRAGQQEAS